MMHKEIPVRVQVPGQGRLQVVYSKEIRVRVHIGGGGRLQQLVMVLYPNSGSVFVSLFNVGLLITK
jgi:hypothetical protein